VSVNTPHADLVVTTIALAIVFTLAAQATTKPWLARRLGLLETGALPQPAYAGEVAGTATRAPPP
jgi:NhaP-type Na+/H+ or K+/H+ antiporter